MKVSPSPDNAPQDDGKDPPSITVTFAETKRILAILAHLNQIVRTALDGNHVRRPIEMDHAELLLAAASIRALFFDDTPKPMLVEFLNMHGLEIQIEAIESNLGLILLSRLLPEPGHISDWLGMALLGIGDAAGLQLDEETELFAFFEDWRGLEAMRTRPDIWVPNKEQDAKINSGLTHLTNVGPSQMLTICRRRVPVADWGRVRLGFLKDRRIDRKNLITYVANKLGGVHYDSARLPRGTEDAEQFKVLATAYDWGEKTLMHAGLVGVALACIEIVNTPELMALRADFRDLYTKRQSLLTEKLNEALRDRSRPSPG